MEFEERPSEPVIVLMFMADEAEPGAWNLPLYAILADPFNTCRLAIDNGMHRGFDFVVHDLKDDTQIRMFCPEELYDLPTLIGAPHAYVVKEIYSRELGDILRISYNNQVVADCKDDPSLMIRSQRGYQPLARHWSHLPGRTPSALEDGRPALDTPPCVVALGFQLAEGKLIGPCDIVCRSSLGLGPRWQMKSPTPFDATVRSSRTVSASLRWNTPPCARSCSGSLSAGGRLPSLPSRHANWSE
jgi:fructose 1,6-bisphosphate aldolase/phosphatase